MTLPTLVIVPGAWHTPRHWDLFVKSMPGVDVRTVNLPSVGRDIAALGDLQDDTTAVRQAVSSVDGPVVVLAHSYGGVPVTEALGEATPNVQRIVYLAAFVLDLGESMVSLATQNGTAPYPPIWGVHRDEGYMELLHAEHFFHDVEPTLAREAIEGLTYQSWSSLDQPLTNVAWRSIPSTYIVCDEDHGHDQEPFAQRTGVVRHISSSHSPFLSKPKELAALLRKEMVRPV